MTERRTVKQSSSGKPIYCIEYKGDWYTAKIYTIDGMYMSSSLEHLDPMYPKVVLVKDTMSVDFKQSTFSESEIDELRDMADFAIRGVKKLRELVKKEGF